VFSCLPPAIDPQRSAAAATRDGGNGGDGGCDGGGDGGSDGGGLRPGLQPRIAGTARGSARGDRLFSKPAERFISEAIPNI
jgi:hypothetical protein